MLIYSPEQSARLQYILDILFRRILGVDYRITHLDTEYLYEEGPKINYSFDPPDTGLFIRASGLLYERVICDQTKALMPLTEWNGLPAFFGVESPSALPFDIFSAAFYLVSRYEEYLPFEPDEHGRFPSAASLAGRAGFLDKPLVHLWAAQLRQIISLWYPTVIFKPVKYQFLPTFDIDNAWAFRHKGWRTLMSLMKPGPMAYRNYRYQVIVGNQPDPYDQYERINRLTTSAGFASTFFFLLGKKSEFDRNISPSNRTLRKKIRQISATQSVGIHPSYQSGHSTQILEKEIHTLEKILDKPVTRSRQHFIKMSMPETYLRLEALGIREDYSMGYPDQTGYRSSLGIPYPFFDLGNNRITTLLVFPFQVMDVTLRQYMKLTPIEAIEHTRQMISEAKESGCCFTTLWHNESLSEWQHWEGWSSVLEKVIQTATE